jgi:hypothetical protein
MSVGAATNLAHHGQAGKADRFAFVTLHYEGTKNDAEYILGIRVLIQSLKGSRYPFIILCSDSVSQSSRDIFTNDGAIIQPVWELDHACTYVLIPLSFVSICLHSTE